MHSPTTSNGAPGLLCPSSFPRHQFSPLVREAIAATGTTHSCKSSLVCERNCLRTAMALRNHLNVCQRDMEPGHCKDICREA